MPLSKESEITTLKGVGSRIKEAFSRLNIFTIQDLLFHVPFRYKDTRDILTLEEFQQEGEGTFLAQIVDVKNIYTRYGKKITKVRVKDYTDKLDLTYFNQTYLEKSLGRKDWYVFDGKIAKKGIYNPKYEKYQGDPTLQTTLGQIYGIYHEVKGLTSRQIRKILLENKEELFNIIKEPLDKNILNAEGLITLQEAVKQIHFPDSQKLLKSANERLAFDEMLRIGIKLEEQIKEREGKKSMKIETNNELENKFLKSLPFKLTDDQKSAIEEINKDINKSIPMNRLLNGDVGSGKTVVAASIILQAIESNFSAILLAPTTVLAKQHYQTLKKFLKPFDIEIELCISEEKTLSEAENKLIVGTHAILFKKDLPDNINLVIVDEQHRFGVEQREYLLNIVNHTPHYLTMTATPIPRSLTEVVFGSTQVSTIKEKPINRKEIITKFVPNNKRDNCFNWVEREIEESKLKKQAFIIYPLIEDNDSYVKSVTTQYEQLRKRFFKSLNVAFLHGRMKDKEKNKILEDFKKKEYSILISTSVIEVGIDIPDATIMIIENAERFGLAQLHQLRGRVGRGDLQSYCFVIPSEVVEEREEALERLQYFAKHSSGFDVAEYDLSQRGPGEVYGIAQSGIPQFKIARLDDLELLKRARSVARFLILDNNLDTNNILENLFK